MSTTNTPKFTPGPAIDLLRALARDKRAEATSLRRIGDEYKRAAADCDDADLRRVQFAYASRAYGDARAADREADTIEEVCNTAAVAPDLLAATELLLHHCESFYKSGRLPAGDWMQARAAITKARGE